MAKKNNNQDKGPGFVEALQHGGASEEQPSGGLSTQLVDDVASITENESILIDVLANDNANINTTLLDASLDIGAGDVQLIDGQVFFDPGTNYDFLSVGETSTVVITYTVQRGNGVTATAQLTFTLTGTNDGPVANVDTATTDENAAITVDVLANDTDVDQSDTHTVDAVSVPAGEGTATIVNNQLHWEPGTDFDYLAVGESATVVVDYTMSDNHGATSSSTLTLTVTGSNDGPVAVRDVAKTTEDRAIKIDVLANDTDVDLSDTHTVDKVVVSQGLGKAMVVGNVVVYDPGAAYQYLAAGEAAKVQLTYAMSDNNGAASTSTVTVSVVGTNDGPVAVRDVAKTTEDRAIKIDVLANDTDVDHGAVLSVDKAWVAKGDGSVVVKGGLVYYNPDGAYQSLAAGEATKVLLGYAISDEHGATSTSTVTITVTGTNDGPVAVADSAATTEDAVLAIDVLANDTDVDLSDVLTVSSFDSTSSGGATVTRNDDGTLRYDQATAYQHLAEGETATDSFSYTISDGNGGTDTATVTVTVEGRNDGPVAVDDEIGAAVDLTGFTLNPDNGHYYKYVDYISGGTDGTWSQAKTAAENMGGYLATVTSAAENAFIKGLSGSNQAWLGANDTATEGTWQWVTGPEAGTTFWVGQSGGSAPSGEYTNWDAGQPDDNNGNEDFLHIGSTDMWNDQSGTTQMAGYVVELEVAALTDEDAPAVITAVDLLANDTDADGDTLSLLSVGNAVNGTVSFTFDAPGISIVDASAQSGPSITKLGWTSTQGRATPFDTSQDLAFQGNGLARVAVTKDNIPGYESIHNPAFANDGYYGNGASWISNSPDSWLKVDLGQSVLISSITFGRDRTDGYDDRDPGQFSIEVAGTDNVYANGDDSNDENEYTQVFDSASAGFSGFVSGPETVQATFAPVVARYVKLNVANFGTAIDELEIFAAGEVVFAPDADFSGQASFDYTVSDGQGGTDTATVTVNVGAVADAPNLSAADVVALADGVPAEIQLAGGAEFQVNSYTTGNQNTPDVTTLAGGGFVVTWQSKNQPEDNDDYGVFGQLYDATGKPLGDEFQVNTYTTSYQGDPSSAALHDGGFVITWTSNTQDGDSSGVYGQRYDSTGKPAGDEFQINTNTASTTHPGYSWQNASVVETLADGSFVVAWNSNTQDGSWSGIYAQRFDAEGKKIDGEFRVNQVTFDDQLYPDISALPDGGYMVT